MQESADDDGLTVRDRALFNLAIDMAAMPPERMRGEWWIQLNMPRLRRSRPDWDAMKPALVFLIDKIHRTRV